MGGAALRLQSPFGRAHRRARRGGARGAEGVRSRVQIRAVGSGITAAPGTHLPGHPGRSLSRRAELGKWVEPPGTWSGNPSPDLKAGCPLSVLLRHKRSALRECHVGCCARLHGRALPEPGGRAARRPAQEAGWESTDCFPRGLRSAPRGPDDPPGRWAGSTWPPRPCCSSCAGLGRRGCGGDGSGRLSQSAPSRHLRGAISVLSHVWDEEQIPQPHHQPARGWRQSAFSSIFQCALWSAFRAIGTSRWQSASLQVLVITPDANPPKEYHGAEVREEAFGWSQHDAVKAVAPALPTRSVFSRQSNGAPPRQPGDVRLRLPASFLPIGHAAPVHRRQPVRVCKGETSRCILTRRWPNFAALGGFLE